MLTLKISHNAGFFSCCSVMLISIIDFFNYNKKIPDNIDVSDSFSIYKSCSTNNIYELFFEKNNLNIEYENPVVLTKSQYEFQFSDYSQINFEKIKPFLDKYFKTNSLVNCTFNSLLQKYNIKTDKLIFLYYRGNDKCTETNLGSYESYLNKANEICSKNLDHKILIQTDEIDFLNYFLKNFKKKNEIIFFEEMSMINKNSKYGIHHYGEQKEDFILYFLSCVKIMSVSNHVITGSNNFSFWATIYRGNCNNINQYLDPNKTIEENFTKLSNIKNKEIISKKNNWLIYK